MNGVLIDSVGGQRFLTTVVLSVVDNVNNFLTITGRFRIIVISDAQAHREARYTDGQTKLPIGQETERGIGGVGHDEI